METIVKYAQGLVYNLLGLMQARLSKSQFQCPIGTVFGSTGATQPPQHTQVKSASAMSAIYQPLSVVYPWCDSSHP